MAKARLAVMLAGTALLVVACGGSSPGPAASKGQGLLRQALTYSRCMRAHGAPEFPKPKPGPGGTLVYPLNPPPGMLASPDYDAAFRACLRLAVTGGQPAARYRAVALQALRQAECMRAHGISGYPSPATLNGGIHSPDFTTPAINTHTLRFQAAGTACRIPDLWRQVWWWPAGAPASICSLTVMKTTRHRRLGARTAHRKRLVELHQRGALLAAGPWDDDSGALLIFRLDE